MLVTPYPPVTSGAEVSTVFGRWVAHYVTGVVGGWEGKWKSNEEAREASRASVEKQVSMKRAVPMLGRALDQEGT